MLSNHRFLESLEVEFIDFYILLSTCFHCFNDPLSLITAFNNLILEMSRFESGTTFTLCLNQDIQVLSLEKLTPTFGKICSCLLYFSQYK